MPTWRSAPERASGAVGLIKRAVLGGADLPLESGLALERELQQRLFTAPDAKEGIDAFLGKRKPRFQGFTGSPVAPASPAAPSTPPPAQVAGTPSPGGKTPPEARPAPAAPASPVSAPTPPVAAPASPGAARSPAPPSPAGPAVAPLASAPSTPGDTALDKPARGRGEEGSIFEEEAVPPEDYDDAPPDVDLLRVRIADEVLNLLPTWLVRQYLVIPLRQEGNTLVVAIEDPGNAEALAAVRDHTCMEARAVRADRDALIARYTMHYRL